MTDVGLYDYDLPRELIAQHPLPNRTDARLMVVDRRRESLGHYHIRDLPELLAAGDCLVLNDTRVVAARLVGWRALTGGRWEGLVLAGDDAGTLKLLARTRGRAQPGERVVLEPNPGRAEAAIRLLEKQPGGIWIAVAEPRQSWIELLERVGRTPLPCYIRHGAAGPADAVRYQTVYARVPGSAAAPTAGLHFTRELLDRLQASGIRQCAVTLHVGLDTFRPVKSQHVEGHAMHREWGCIDAPATALINQTRSAGGRIVAVGTTSVRVLETAATPEGMQPWSGETSLFIFGDYRFRAVDALLTNFHLPRSTLLMLVRSFGGDALIRRAYAEAIAQRYRFYSYGDAMLII